MVRPCSKEKFIFRPFQGIIPDIISNALMFCLIADDMVIETGLPGEIWHNFSNVDGAYPFVLVDDYANGAGMPLRVVPPGFSG